MSALSILQERWNNELEQALIRLLVGVIVGLFIASQIYIGNAKYYTAHLWFGLGIFLALAILLTILIIHTQKASFYRRLIGIFTDIFGLSFALHSMDESGAVLFSLYLWVIMGNGLRFGKVYLYIAMLCAIAGFSLVIISNTYWSQHLYLSMGILIAFIALPLYFSKLLTRLIIVNATLEHRVLERTAELEIVRDHALAANKAKSQFLANMSHELRTPLNAIIGYSEILKETALDDKRENDLADLKKIHHSGKHLLKMVNEILDLNKIEAGKMNLQRDPIKLKALFHYIAETIQPLLRDNNNELIIDIDSDIDDVIADEMRLRQVLLNLVSNANKFTNNGTIELQAKARLTGLSQSIDIFVRDTGVGISEKNIAAIFQPFFQEDNTYTRKYEGSGLGLAISQNLCRMMGGDLYVDSTQGKGSVFTVSLPGS